MKSTSCLILLFILYGVITTEPLEITEEEQMDKVSLQYKCSYFENFAIFTYLPIEDKIPDNEFKTPYVRPDVSNQNIYFSFCNDAQISCNNAGDIGDPGSALLKDETTGDCTPITTESWEDATPTYVKNDLDRSRDYLRLTWDGRTPCPSNTNVNLGYAIDVICTDAVEAEDARFYFAGMTGEDKCTIRTVFESKLGCAIVSYREVAEFLSDNYIIFGSILIVLGFFLLIFGYRLLLVALFISGVIATVLAAAVISFQFFINKNTEQYVLWIILGVSFVFGCIVGYALVKFRKGGLFILSAIGGVCIALILNSAVFRYAQSKALFWVVIGACALGCGILSCFLGVIISIGATSLIGSYSLVRGISVFVGHFPDEVSLIEQIKNGTTPKTDAYFWGYCAGIIVLFIIGFFIQWRFRPEKGKNKKRREEYYRL